MIRRGSITDEDVAFVETWENIAVSSYDVIRLDKRGDETHEMIIGRRTFMLTTEERLITQDRILDEANDPFLNGAFRPVVVPETITVASNPNALSDDEIRGILVGSALAWDEWIKVIDAPATLQRMIDISDEADDLDIALSRYKQIKARLAEVKPKTQIQQKDREEFERIGTQTGSAARKAAAQKTA